MSEISSININSLSEAGVSRKKSGILAINGKFFFQQKLLPLLIVFMAFVAMSPVLSNFGWRGIFSLVIVVGITLFFLSSTSLKAKKWFIYLTLLIFISSSITGLYWVDIRYIFANIFIIGILFLIQFSTLQIISKAVDIASVLLLIIVIGSVIGFVIAFLGLPSMTQILNPDGRPNHFFYTTLSNAVMGNIIRPAGIYDEPGALSFYICAIAVMRHMLGKNNKLTWSLLMLGFVTLSLAHLIYVLFHLIAERLTKNNLKSVMLIFLTASSLIFITGFNSVIEDELLLRLVFSQETGSFEGDNRTEIVANVFNHIKNDKSILLFGADPSCRFSGGDCRLEYGQYGSNFLSPVFSTGIFVSWFYYLVILLFLISPLLGRRYFVVFGFGLLLLQRPDMLGLPASMVSILILFLLFYKFNILNSHYVLNKESPQC